MFPSILIVDDEPSILQSLSGLLSDEGFEVITASNGYEALKTIDDESPDLVLLDIWMPGMDGIESTRQIRNYYNSIGLRREDQPLIVAVSGHAGKEYIDDGIKAGLPRRELKRQEPLRHGVTLQPAKLA